MVKKARKTIQMEMPLVFEGDSPSAKIVNLIKFKLEAESKLESHIFNVGLPSIVEDFALNHNRLSLRARKSQIMAFSSLTERPRGYMYDNHDLIAESEIQMTTILLTEALRNADWSQIIRTSIPLCNIDIAVRSSIGFQHSRMPTTSQVPLPTQFTTYYPTDIANNYFLVQTNTILSTPDSHTLNERGYVDGTRMQNGNIMRKTKGPKISLYKLRLLKAFCMYEARWSKVAFASPFQFVHSDRHICVEKAYNREAFLTFSVCCLHSNFISVLRVYSIVALRQLLGSYLF
jgi:hypothetical protein